MTFVVFMFFSACPHLHVRLHSPWFYVTAGMKIHDHLQYKLAQSSYVFSNQNNISCTRSICAYICADVSGDFNPNFHYNIYIYIKYMIFKRIVCGNILNKPELFIIMGFRTIVFIFIVISTTFQPICPLAFFRCLSNSGTFTELWTTSFMESMKFCEGSWVRQTPEEGRRTYQPKRCENNNKDEDNRLKTLDDKNHQASSQNFKQLINQCLFVFTELNGFKYCYRILIILFDINHLLAHR